MLQQPTAQQGAKPVNVPELIKDLTSLIADCSVCEDCDIHKLTIVVNGRKNREHVSKVFNFSPGNIPAEMKEFFIAYRKNLLAQVTELQQSTPMVKLGNQVVAIADLLTDYTAGEIPAIDTDTAQAIRDMKPGALLTVLINDTPHQLQRIN